MSLERIEPGSGSEKGLVSKVWEGIRELFDTEHHHEEGQLDTAQTHNQQCPLDNLPREMLEEISKKPLKNK